jgi:pimeloyl-ACP methyl ester carboxylesterase
VKTRVLFSACVLAVLTCIPVGGRPASTTVLPDGTYQYSLEQAGTVLGKSTIVVKRVPVALTISESGSFAGTVVSTVHVFDLPALSASSYLAAAPAHAGIVINGTTATLTRGPTTQKVSAEAGKPFVIFDNLVGSFAQMPAALHGAKSFTLACACSGNFLAVPGTIVDSVAARPANVPAGDALLAMAVAGVTILIWYDPHSLIVDRAEVPSQSFVITLTSRSDSVDTPPVPTASTPVPLPSPHYSSRDVTFAADDGVRLAGTITLPDEVEKPIPGFVLVHGSGCSDRDESIGPNHVFGQIASNLSNNGYAVLRYDKRSCGKSGGTFAVRDRLIADARDAIAYLRAQPGIDAARIYVLGHSEGGELAPSIAVADGKLRGIVLMAPPAIPLEKILMQQTLRTVAPADREKTEQAETAALKEIADGKKTDTFSAWLRSSFGVDPAAIIAKVPCPILILQGTKDAQVLPADTPRLVDAARAAGRNVTVVMLTGDDHLFINLPGNQPSTMSEYFVPSYLDPALFAAIENWLANGGK